MAWIAEDDFDSYSGATVTLAGGAGGSGWTSNWAETGGGSGDWVTETAPAGGQGGVSAHSANFSTYRRTFTATGSGVLTWEMQRDTTNPDNTSGIGLRTGTNGRIFVFFGSTGNLSVEDNGVITSLGIPYSVNTWYRFTVEFGHVANKFRVKVDAGAYSSDFTVNGGSLVTVDALEMEHSAGAGNMYVDDIRPEAAAPPITDAPELIRTVHSGIRFR